MEPMLSVASPIIQKAAELGRTKLEAADQLAASDARRYVSYLEVALEAIHGLENDYIDILVEAKHCQVDQPEQSRHLAMRIDQHLYREALRPLLVGAVGRLEFGRQALADHADRVFVWPSVKQGRADALAAYDKLLKRLRSYIDQLGQWYAGASHQYLMDPLREGKPMRMGGTGLNVVWLHSILDCLNRQDQEKLSEVVAGLLGDLESDRHLSLTRDIGRVIEAMLITFR